MFAHQPYKYQFIDKDEIESIVARRNLQEWRKFTRDQEHHIHDIVKGRFLCDNLGIFDIRPVSVFNGFSNDKLRYELWITFLFSYKMWCIGSSAFAIVTPQLSEPVLGGATKLYILERNFPNLLTQYLSLINKN